MLAIGHHRLAVRLSDISLGGCQVRLAVPLVPGSSLHVESPVFGRLPAVVAWTRGDLLGLAFLGTSPAALRRLGRLLREPVDAGRPARD